MSTVETGRQGEDLAVVYLEAKGYRVLARNYRFERSEMDIICFLPAPSYTDGGEMVFVEVKTRTGTGYGRPEEAVTPAKKRHLIRAARAWMHENRMDGTPCRFDVVSVLMPRGRDPEIEHFEHAFWTF